MKVANTPEDHGKNSRISRRKTALIQARVDVIFKNKVRDLAAELMLDESDILRHAVAAFVRRRVTIPDEQG